MIKHIVMWRFKDTAHGNDRGTNALLAREKLEDLRGRIPGLLSIEVGLDFSATANSADVVLVCEFADLAALQRYQSHPLHQAVVPFVAEAASERRLVDYEVGG